MKRLLLFAFLLVLSIQTFSQEKDELPFQTIPDYPKAYTAGTVLSRMVDGLGFRYYWATESLRPEDLSFKPSEEARTSLETLEHIYGLTNVIVNAAQQKPNIRDTASYSYEELRKMTLNNLKTASEILLKSSASDIENYKLVFGTSEYPFWNNINGPIADALWHVGQVVSFRRSSGNPFNSNVSVFNGRLRE